MRAAGMRVTTSAPAISALAASLALALMAIASVSAAGQTSAPQASGSDQSTSAAQPAETHVPVPWQPDEFPGWMRDLRRGEILFLGSLPFSFFYTFEVYDLYRYAASGLDPLQAPWPFRAAADIQYTDSEKGRLVASALAVSLAVAVTDFVVGRLQRRK